MLDALYLYNYLEQKKAFFSYVGEMDHLIINSLLKTMKNTLNEGGVEYKIVRRIYSVLVESLENISRHGIPFIRQENAPEKPISKGILILSFEGDYFCITTGNFIQNTLITELSEKIITIKSLDNRRLKEMYRNQLLSHNKQFKLKGNTGADKGSGVGIIDIAIKTDKNFEHKFIPVDDDVSMFVMEIRIKTNS